MAFNWRSQQRGQSIIEFSFAMILTALLLFGMVRVFQWSGLILAEHRIDDEKAALAKDKDPLCKEKGTRRNKVCPHQQLEEDYFKPRKMNAIFRFKE